MIRFNCPSCGAEITDQDESAGKQKNCVGCGEIIHIPGCAKQETTVFRPTHVWDAFFITSLAPIWPSRQSLLKPWKWSRSTWAAVVPIMLVVYFLSAVPVMKIAVAGGMLRYPAVISVITVVYSPVWWCTENSAAVDAILGREQELVVWLMTWMGFGEATPPPPA